MITAASAQNVDKMLINIGSGSETSVRELARLAVEITGGHPEVVFNPRNEGGISRLCADITLAKDFLGYEPSISLEEGLTRTLNHDIAPTNLL